MFNTVDFTNTPTTNVTVKTLKAIRRAINDQRRKYEALPEPIPCTATRKADILESVSGSLVVPWCFPDELKGYTRQSTCAEQVYEQWENRANDFRVFMEDTEGNDDIGSFYDYGLEMAYRPLGTWEGQKEDFFEYLLSYGGPSEHVRFYESARVEYRFHNWNDGAGIDITTDPVGEWLRDYFEGCDIINFEGERANPEHYPDGFGAESYDEKELDDVDIETCDCCGTVYASQK